MILIKKNHINVIQKSKQELIEKINQIKMEINIQVQNTMEKVYSFIEGLNDQIKASIKLSSQFNNLCDSIIYEIQSIKCIGIKQFYTPLESILLSSNIDLVLSMIKGPTIIFSEKKITYIPSDFPHYLYNYSDYAIAFSSEDTIHAYPSNKMMKNSAVIGGTNNDNSIDTEMNTVEILKSNKWTQGPSINIPRDSHTSVNHHNSVWVIGGINWNTRLDSIERFSGFEWKLIDLKLNIPCTGIGILCTQNCLLIIGGRSSPDNNINSIFWINLTDFNIKELTKINQSIYCASNHFFISSSEKLILAQDLITKGRGKLNINLEEYF